MRHGVLGPGGIGGLVGAVLAHAGQPVTLMVRPGTEALYPHQLSLESTFGNINPPVRIGAAPEQPFDVLWITVKATQLEHALHGVPCDLQVHSVVPLLNGIDHVQRLRQQFGAGKVIPATIAVESERMVPGKIVHRSPFVRFRVSAAGSDVLGPAVDVFQRFGFDCQFVADERTLLWSKLVFLAPIALSTAAARGPVGHVLSSPVRRAQLEACVREAGAVAMAAGATVDANAVLASIMALPSAMRSSMEKDVARGNSPELDAISGPIIRGGDSHGIPVPATAELVEAVSQQRRSP